MKMKPALIAFTALAAVGGLLAAPANTPESSVEVNYVSPENFSDLRDEFSPTEKGQEGYMEFLRDYLKRQAPRHLAAGQKLSVTFTDIDMAGDFEPWRGVDFHRIRVVKEIYPPRVKFSFKLTDADGKVVKEGEREIRDTNFMFAPPGFRDDPLRYECNLLADWLRSEFPRAKK